MLKLLIAILLASALSAQNLGDGGVTVYPGGGGGIGVTPGTFSINTSTSTCTAPCTASPTAGTGPGGAVPGAVVPHNLGTSTPWVTLWDSSGNMLGSWNASGGPLISVVANTANQVTLSFQANFTGVAVISTGAMGPIGPTGVTGATGSAGTNGTNGAISRIQSGGSAVAIEPFLNFVNGGCVDNPGATRTDCTIGGAAATVAPFSYFPFPANADFGSEIVPQSSAVRYWMFTAPYAVTVDHVSLAITGNGANHIAVGVYSAACALVASGTGFAFTGGSTVALTLSASLTAGTTYHFAITSDSANGTDTFDKSTGLGPYLNPSGGQVTAFNGGNTATWVAGAVTFPATCGTKTPGSLDPPLAMLY